MTHWSSSRPRTTGLLLAMAIGFGWPAAHAQDAAALRAQSLASTCAACHGSQGRAVAGTSIPGLAGMPAPQLIAQMKAFQTGSRPSTVMQQIAKGYSDARIAQIAAFFAAQGAP